MSLTSYVTLGRSGLRVSPFCLGAMTFGEEWGWGSTPEVSQAILAEYLDRGGNFIDTANIYSFGHAEAIIGDYVAAHRDRRDNMVIATKFSMNLYPGDPNGGGAGRKALMAQAEHSLRRLRTDYIDLYWLHCDDPFTPLEETLRGLDDLVSSGKVRYIGFSDTPAWRIARAHTIAELRGWSPLAAIQIEYSLLERTVESELIPMARELGLGVTPWSPLRGGALTGKFTRANRSTVKAESGSRAVKLLTDRDYDLIDELGRIATELDATVAAVALAWVRGRPGISSTIIGARTPKQLSDNLAALDLALTSDQLERLDRLSAPKHNFPSGFLKLAPSYMHGGARVNDVESTHLWVAPPNDADRY